MPDLQFCNHGSAVSMVCATENGLDWVLDNVRMWDMVDRRAEVGFTVYLEHRFMPAIVEGARADGLVCEG